MNLNLDLTLQSPVLEQPFTLSQRSARSALALPSRFSLQLQLLL